MLAVEETDRLPFRIQPKLQNISEFFMRITERTHILPMFTPRRRTIIDELDFLGEAAHWRGGDRDRRGPGDVGDVRDGIRGPVFHSTPFL